MLRQNGLLLFGTTCRICRHSENLRQPLKQTDGGLHNGPFRLIRPTRYEFKMESTRHILTSFEFALDNLRKDVLLMSSLAMRSLENAKAGLVERDEDKCNTVIADDGEIDDLEIRVDNEGIEIMMRFQPFASDLRNVIAAMKTSVNPERAADQCVGIARRVRKLDRTRTDPVTAAPRTCR